MGFGQGLSGLNAASQNLDVIGNNIANSNTVGFKSASVSFADVYASSRVGLGVNVAAINQRFTVGTVASTGGEFDIAIDGAKGFFRVTDPSGAILYTRNGEFSMDKNYYIVNAQGYRLTGYPAGAVGANPVELRIPQANISPVATTSIDFTTNLNANADTIPLVNTSGQIRLGPTNGAYDGTTYYFNVDSVTGNTMLTTDNAIPGTAAADGTYTDSAGNTITVTGGVVAGSINASSSGYMPYRVAVPFSPTDSNSYTDSVPVTVYDSLGNSHQLVQYFIKRDPSPAAPNGTESQYGVVYYLDGQPVTAPATETTMSFDKNGALLDPSTVNLTYAGIGGSNSPASDLNIAVNYTGTTQYGNDFSPKFTQNGYSSGEFMGVSIAKDGTVMASYTNGQSQSIGTIALANFNNVQGLQPVGNNAWSETTESGQALLGQPGTNGLATLQGQALEQSNVNMSNELVNMIVAQRTYQANTQTIKTQDEILQTLMNI